MTTDRRHNAIRQKLRDEAGKRGGSVAHLSSGVKSFGYGMMGGLTSVITQPYYGYADDGFEVREKAGSFHRWNVFDS